MENRAYIAGSLDCAILFKEHKKPCIIYGKGDNLPIYIDDYQLSQIYASNPEIIETTYTEIDDLQKQIGIEWQKQQALTIALDIMDSSYPLSYRNEAAALLAREIDTNPNLFAFLQNRFLSTPLPEEFNSKEAESIASVAFRSS